MPVRFGIRFPPCDDPRAAAALAAEAERVGFDCIWSVDSPMMGGRLGDPYVMLAACGLRTTRVRLGPAVTNPTLRHPAVTAATIESLDRLSGGRAVLGIGTGASSMWTVGRDPEPLARLREVIGFFKTLFATGAGRLDGHEYRAARAPIRIPIYVAATGPRMLELAGEVADGVIVQVGLHPACLDWAKERIAAGARRGGRRLEEVDLVCSTFSAFGPDRAACRDRLRPLMVQFYRLPRLIEIAGLDPIPVPPEKPYPDFGHAVDWDEAMRMARWVPDEAVEHFHLLGTPAEAVERIQALAAAGIHEVFLRHDLTYALPHELVALAGRDLIPAVRAAGR